MSEQLEGNCLVAQSGGPTSVINASLAGVVSEALNHECIEAGSFAPLPPYGSKPCRVKRFSTTEVLFYS